MAKSNKTAAELLAELNKNDSYKKTIESKEKEQKVDQNLLQEDELRISNALREVGISINTIYDLVNTNNPYPKAIPILIDFLENKKVQHNQVIEGIIRALAVKEAVSIANRHLIKLYNESVKEDATFCWAIGNTVDAIVCDDDIDDVIKIVKDKSNGVSRQMFVLALGKVKSVKAEQALISLLDDDEVSPHALDALGRLKSQKAKSKISELTNHQKPLIRKEAQKALKKIK